MLGLEMMVSPSEFEDDSFLDLEFALNENRIVSSQMFLIITDKSNI